MEMEKRRGKGLGGRDEEKVERQKKKLRNDDEKKGNFAALYGTLNKTIWVSLWVGRRDQPHTEGTTPFPWDLHNTHYSIFIFFHPKLFIKKTSQISNFFVCFQNIFLISFFFLNGNR